MLRPSSAWHGHASAKPALLKMKSTSSCRQKLRSASEMPRNRLHSMEKGRWQAPDMKNTRKGACWP